MSPRDIPHIMKLMRRLKELAPLASIIFAGNIIREARPTLPCHTHPVCGLLPAAWKNDLARKRSLLLRYPQVRMNETVRHAQWWGGWGADGRLVCCAPCGQGHALFMQMAAEEYELYEVRSIDDCERAY
jgi:hypothetical protein